MRILISTSYALPFEIPPGRYGDHEVDVMPRGSDWAIGPWRKYPHYWSEAWKLCRMASRYDALAVLTTGMETFLLGRMLQMTRCKTRLVAADFLIPRPSRELAWIDGGLQRVDAFACIRSGDIETLGRRFGIAPERCAFAPFPCNPRIAEIPNSENGYVYSAGWAHRDWKTLICALEASHARAILSAGGDFAHGGSAEIKIMPQRSPEEGRKLMAHASLVVLPLEETELPSGPVVLLDAMAMGKAVIVTDVNGTRDYVRHGENAWVVPPGNAKAMADAIAHLMETSALRKRIGFAAQETVLRQFTPERFINALIQICILK
jgi:hypothetical protein